VYEAFSVQYNVGHQGNRMSKNVTSAAVGIQINLSPYSFNHYASEYLTVARSIKVGPSFSPVPYYLYCRCLELGVKAFLLLKGVTKQELKTKSLGHNLVDIVVKAESLGLSENVKITKKENSEISKANNYYKNKDFEYVNILKTMKGYPLLPDLHILDKLAERIVGYLKEVCLNA
jgi:hypothetical protein